MSAEAQAATPAPAAAPVQSINMHAVVSAAASAAKAASAKSVGAPAADAKPAEAKPADVKPPEAKPAEPQKEPPRASNLAEVQRKEWAFRQEQKKWADERKAWEAQQAEAKEREERFKVDPGAVLEHYGYKPTDVIDYFAKGGSDSPDAKVRALEAKIARKEREDAEAAKKRDEDNQRQAEERGRQAAVAYVHSEVPRVISSDTVRFELVSKMAASQEYGPGYVANQVLAIIKGRYEKSDGQISLTVEQALQEAEDALDSMGYSLAQSKKIQSRLGKGAEPKPDEQAPRQSGEVQTAVANQRTVTIRNRTQAVAPSRSVRDRVTTQEAKRQAAENLRRLFAR